MDSREKARSPSWRGNPEELHLVGENADRTWLEGREFAARNIAQASMCWKETRERPDGEKIMEW